MTQFEERLRRGMMDANVAQYGRVIQRMEARELDASPQYYRERARLLANPWGWANRRAGTGRTRLNWRLAAIVAALLLLTACAYAAVTGRFSQWFPRMGVDPAAPEQSEGVLNRTGTVIEQSQTVGDTTVTLNAAVWDGTYVYLSFTVECPGLPEELPPFDTRDCRLTLRRDQWEEYERNRVEEFYAGEDVEEIEEAVRAALEKGPDEGLLLHLQPEEREGNTLTFRPNGMLLSRLFTETARPELTLHLENIAVETDSARQLGPGEILIRGPFDLTFTLNEPLPPIRYGGAGVEAPVMDIPLRFTGFQVSATEVTAFYEVLNPEADPKAVLWAAYDSVRGLWTEDGKYVDLTESGSDGGGDYVSVDYPYPIDPAAVTAVDVGGIRVELSELNRLSE